MFKLPHVRTADEILDSAFNRASKVTVGKGRKIVKEKMLSIGKVKTITKYISKELANYIRDFPNIDELHEFYKELLDVTIGLDKLRHNLGALDRCRKVAVSIGNTSIRNLKRSNDHSSIEKERKGAYGRMSSVLKESSENLEFLKEVKKKLKGIPEIDTQIPTIVIAGYPNVGKSQLVKNLSSAKPKVASYPFTTKMISIGVFEKGYRRYQVIDTPGLLDRPYEKRNRIERQAVSALRHLAGAILFLIDPTETCGYDVDSQLRLLESIRNDFSTPIVEVENKLDLKKDSSDRIKISALTGDGIEDLRETILGLLVKVRVQSE
jgi:nucleolar GTP-binding protein